MTTVEAHFIYTKVSEWPPHIMGQEPTAYECDGKEGFITFNGSYYVENHPPPYPEDEAIPVYERKRRYTEYLPMTHFLSVKIRETEPYRVDVSSSVITRNYKTLEENLYMVEVYKKVVHECTDQYGPVDLDGNGELTNVCFTPTNKQTLYFRVLEVIETTKQLKDLIERNAD
jgi:hypothetical protein